MPTRYFYDCPIIAAYMCQEFGFVFGIEYKGKLVWDWIDIMNTPHPAKTSLDILQYYPDVHEGALYVHPNCHGMLKPQVGDIIICDHRGEVREIEHIKEDWCSFADSGSGCNFAGVREIIRRDDKQFFTPKREES